VPGSRFNFVVSGSHGWSSDGGYLYDTLLTDNCGAPSSTLINELFPDPPCDDDPVTRNLLSTKNISSSNESSTKAILADDDK